MKRLIKVSISVLIMFFLVPGLTYAVDIDGKEFQANPLYNAVPDGNGGYMNGGTELGTIFSRYEPYELADGTAAFKYSYALKITNNTVSPAAEVHFIVFGYAGEFGGFATDATLTPEIPGLFDPSLAITLAGSVGCDSPVSSVGCQPGDVQLNEISPIFFYVATALPGEADALVFDGQLDAIGTTWSATGGENGGGGTVTSDIQVSPDPPLIDFGFVELGTTTTTEVTISNVGTEDLTVLEVFIEDGGSGDFSFTLPSTLPAVIPPNSNLAVTVTYAPSTLEYSYADLVITSTDPDENEIRVQLEGTGVWQNLPVSEQMAYIISFFDESLAQGALEGCGKLPIMVKLRLNAIRNMFRAADSLIERGWVQAARLILKRAYVHSDGLCWPIDFVKGDARPALADMIRELMGNLK
jgi:HYDIN/CFA65/VesB-like, Ig-like domain